MFDDKAIARFALPLMLFFAVILPFDAYAAQGMSLDQVYAAALKRSESTAIQLESVNQAEERYRQARSAVLPSLSASASGTWMDPLPTGSASPNAQNYQPYAKLTLSQPLFRGMREYAALRQGKDLLAAQQQDYRHARVQLYKDVLQNFYTVLSLESQIRNYQEEIRLNHEREADIRERVRIGRSPRSELLNLLSTISTLKATIQQLHGQLQVARQAFAFLSGLDAETPLQDSTRLPSRLEPLDSYLSKLVDRPDVHAARQRLQAANEGVKIARGERLPSLDLNANYYLKRPGYLNDSKWDLGLSITMPLYEGGAIGSKVREAESQRSQAQLTQSQVQRRAEQEIRSLYMQVNLVLDQVEALKAATEAARKSYQAQQHDYRLGLVSNLDVIQSLTAYQQNRRALDNAEYTARSDYLQLQASVLHLPNMSEAP